MRPSSIVTTSHKSLITTIHASCVLALGLVMLPINAKAQSSAVVDEGTFMVTQSGTPLGRESFRIVRAPAPGGQVYRATGQSALGGNRVTTSLGTDSSGVPVSYESELTQRGEVVQRLNGRGRPGRFSVLIRTKNGESSHEYVLNNGALLMDDDVFHHFFFVPLAALHSQLAVIAPGVTEPSRFRLEERGNDTIQIANRSIPSRHFALIGPTGATREVWIDEKGRLLKVALAEKSLVALRDDPPR
ncbi:MAG TPA: hypothetical protein VIF32_10250 [Gemmatimonadaceae bacterium]